MKDVKTRPELVASFAMPKLRTSASAKFKMGDSKCKCWFRLFEGVCFSEEPSLNQILFMIRTSKVSH